MAGKKIKIALMWPVYDGKYTSFNELARRLDPERFETIIICLKEKPGCPSPVDKYGRRVYYLTRDRRINAFSPGILFRLIKILKNEKIDILHAHRHKPSFYAFMAKIFRIVPTVIVHVHGLNRTRNLTRKHLNRFIYKSVDKVIGCADGVCEDVKKRNPGLDHSKVVVLENSVDYEVFAGAVADRQSIRDEFEIKDESFVFLAIGRYVPTKGFKYLIEAFSKVRQANQNCELLIAGDGRDKAETEEMVRNLGLGDCVHMPGNRSDIPQIMKACDCFVMSSIAEGMPLSLLEAMSSGLPCIATNVGGIPEVLNSEEVGFVVESKNPDALAGAMIKCANMGKDEVTQIKEKCRERIRTKYSNEVVVSKLQKLYEEEMRKV